MLNRNIKNYVKERQFHIGFALPIHTDVPTTINMACINPYQHTMCRYDDTY